jgi:hypothetical protein
MNTVAGRPIKVAISAALMAAVFFALPVKMDAQHPLGFSTALAGKRHDSASPYNNNTDNNNPEQNPYLPRKNSWSKQSQSAQPNGN